MQSTESGTLWGNENAWKCEFNFSSRFQCCPTLSGRGGNIRALGRQENERPLQIAPQGGGDDYGAGALVHAARALHGLGFLGKLFFLGKNYLSHTII